jgi:hypothetical protein
MKREKMNTKLQYMHTYLYFQISVDLVTPLNFISIIVISR